MFSLVLAVLFVSAASLLLISIIVAYSRTGVPTVMASRAAQRIAAEVLAKHGARTVYELGSGKGDFALTLADQLPEAHVTGYEVSLLPYLYSQVFKRFHRAGKRVRFMLRDFKKVDLSDADAVVFYLMIHANKKLAPKLERELKPGTLVVSISFSIADWKPAEVIKAQNWSQTRILVYRMPVTHQ